MGREPRIYSFDLGIGSIGECVREGSTIKHLNALLLPAEFASTMARAQRWRMIRGRMAHKAREEWWRKIAKEAGIEVLESRQPGADLRLLKEFPSKGEDELYTSSLLRIALLQGQPLKPWQIYKAIWSALQHRGYDPDPAWKRKAKGKTLDDAETMNDSRDTKDNDDEKESKESMGEYETFLKNNLPEQYRYPCYYDALKVGIWSPNSPKDLSIKIGAHPTPCRGRTAPRSLVEKELRMLLTNASKQFPYLSDKIDYVLFGESGKAYASITDPAWRHIRGRSEEWHGVLGQKVPRFDNRIIAKCRLIPRLNTCNADDFLAREVVFLTNLKNVRYVVLQTGSEEALTPPQIQELFDAYRKRLITSRSPNIITPTKWKQWLANQKGIPSPAHPSIVMPRTGGRSRFSRPALRILREILLSGKSPHLIHQQWINAIKHDNPTNDTTKGLIPDDVKFLLDMPAQWHSFWIPDARESFTGLVNQTQKDSAFNKILESVNNPKVRHRILLFRQRLEQLKKDHGLPDRVIIEIVRDDFMGKEKKREYEQFLHRMQKEKAEAVKDAENSGLKGRDAVLKLRLYREQKGFDVYSGLPIALEHIDHCQIDHIVPRALGGPDAIYNKVLTTAKNNAEKGNRTPYQWLHDGATNHWNDYLKTIPGKAMSKKKMQLLTSTDATELVSKYTALAETAHMVQLARKVVCLTFGWAENAANTVNNLKVVSGGETAKLRQRLRLDSILHPEMDIEKLKETVLNGKLNAKNRENPRHHALDALTASVIPVVRYDTKSNSDVIPSWFTKDYCAKALEHVTPPLIRFERGNLAQTIFGIRHNALVGKKNGKVDKQTVLVGREELHKKVKIGDAKDFFDLGYARKNVENIFDIAVRKLFSDTAFSEGMDQEKWTQFMKSQSVHIKKLLMIVSDDPTFYKEIRAGSGQYFQSQKHKGFLIALGDDGKWKVKPVYAFEKSPPVPTDTGPACKRYYVHSGQLIKVQSNCNMSTKNKVLAGMYYLASIQNGITAVLNPVQERKRRLVVNIQTLMGEGKAKPI